MAETVQIEYKGDLSKQKREVDQFYGKVEQGAAKQQGAFKGLAGSAAKYAVGLGAAAIATDALKDGIDEVLRRETAMAEFSAITGIAGAELDSFKQAAIGLSNEFGTGVIENIESFKGIVGALGPDIAADSAALQSLGKDVNTLAIISGTDATTAMNALNTSILQFGVDLTDTNAVTEFSTRALNALAAGAQAGAAEVTDLTPAFEKAGTTLSQFNVGVEGGVALLETLAQRGFKAGEAGTALRNVLTLTAANASGPANDAFAKLGTTSAELGEIVSDPSRGPNEAFKLLRQRLSEIPSKAERVTLLTKIYGRENLAAASSLIELTATTDEFQAAVTGTNSAMEQLNTVTDTTQEKWDKLTNQIGNFFVGALDDAKSGIQSYIVALTELDVAELQFQTTNLATFGALEKARKAQQKVEAEARKIEQQNAAAAKERQEQQAKDAEIYEANKDAIDAYTQELKDQGKTYREINQLVRERFTNEGDLFGDLDAGGDAAAKTLRTLKDEYSRLMDEYEGTPEQTAKLKELKAEIDRLEAPFKQAADKGVKPLAGTMGDLQAQLSEVNAELQDKLTPGTEAYTAALEKQAQLTATIEARTEAFEQSLAGIRIQQQGLARSAAGGNALLSPFIDEDGQLQQFGDNLASSITEINGIEEQLARDRERRANERLEALDREAQFTITAFSAIGQALGGAAAGGEDAWKGLLKSILNATIDAVEAEILAAEAFSAAKGIFTGGISLITDAPLLLLALTAAEGARALVNSLDTGGVLKQDQLIMAHKDETVIPFDKAPAFFAEAVNKGAGSGGRGRQPYRPSRPTRTKGSVDVKLSTFARDAELVTYEQTRGVA